MARSSGTRESRANTAQCQRVTWVLSLSRTGPLPEGFRQVGTVNMKTQRGTLVLREEEGLAGAHLISAGSSGLKFFLSEFWVICGFLHPDSLWANETRVGVGGRGTGPLRMGSSTCLSDLRAQRGLRPANWLSHLFLSLGPAPRPTPSGRFMSSSAISHSLANQHP